MPQRREALECDDLSAREIIRFAGDCSQEIVEKKERTKTVRKMEWDNEASEKNWYVYRFVYSTENNYSIIKWYLKRDVVIANIYRQS